MTPKTTTSRQTPKSTRRSTPRSTRRSAPSAAPKSTPRTTRKSTPRSMSLKNGKQQQQQFQLIYRPLELDNESSSESTDSLVRRRGYKRNCSPEIKIPLAIEAPPPPSQDFLIDCENFNKKEQIVDVEDTVHIEGIKKQKTGKSDSLDCKLTERSQNKKPIEIIDIIEASQCITPPITPEKIKEVEVILKEEEGEIKLKSRIKNFIPGNCNIEEILRIYTPNVENLKPDTKVQQESNVE